jgi:hypothetical protein
MELQGNPDFEQAMKRIDAWFSHSMVDRPPVRFAEHNAGHAAAHTPQGRSWPGEVGKPSTQNIAMHARTKHQTQDRCRGMAAWSPPCS